MQFRRSNIRLCIYAGFYILYLVIGASVFSAIEGPRERELVSELREQRHQFFKDHQNCMTGNLIFSSSIFYIRSIS